MMELLMNEPAIASSMGAPAGLLHRLGDIVGKRFLLTSERETRRFRTGFRFGSGDALAVVRPGSLVELWKVANTCAEAGVIVIMQAANTGSRAARRQTATIMIATS
jgi:D-lactate dehydrogenase